jgi:2-methylcitrate synthase
LSGVAAGNTALCTVGRSGNDLHYRGYDIHDLAAKGCFEEVAYLLVHGVLPTWTELQNYKAKLKRLRGLPAPVKAAMELLPAATHPMDVLRTGCSVLGTVLPEKDDHNVTGARNIADRLMASFGSMLLYWYHFSHNGKHIETETDDDSIAGHFLHLLHGKKPSDLHANALDKSLVLYAEHEFNASTFASRVIAGTGSDIYSAITGAIGALRGPKHGGANEVAMEIIARYRSADDADADIRARVERKEIIIGFGHPVYTVSDPRNEIIKEVSRKRCIRADREGDGRGQEDVSQPRLVLGQCVSHDGRAHCDVHAAVRDRAHVGLERACDRATSGRQDHPPQRQLHRAGRSVLRADRQTLSQIVANPEESSGFASSPRFIDRRGAALAARPLSIRSLTPRAVWRVPGADVPASPRHRYRSPPAHPDRSVPTHGRRTRR